MINLFQSRFPDIANCDQYYYPILKQYGDEYGIGYNNRITRIPIVLATGNNVKINRFKDYIEHFAAKHRFLYTLHTLSDASAPEIYYSYTENAKIKNDMAYYRLNESECVPNPIMPTYGKDYHYGDYIIITDDSGLEIPALDNWPGVKTKRAATNYNPVDDTKDPRDMSSAEVILDNISRLDESERRGFIYSACCVSLVNCDRKVFPAKRCVAICKGVQPVLIGLPENFIGRPMTAYDICSPYIQYENTEDSPIFTRPTYSQMSTAEMMIYGDYMYHAFDCAMEQIMDSYIEALRNTYNYKY